MKNPRKKKPVTHNTRTDTKVSVGWSGPLPPPAALEQFDTIIENGAERIFKMAEAEQSATNSLNLKPYDKTIAEVNGWALSLQYQLWPQPQ
ncbi:DUF2335 domain-containing protein [Methylomonas rapida]|uniref:DUF2335 domain-containing protein n=1 Tax=Methylomonas rapida TaxID=2963939 RepID=A0ABY7GHN4_9GAMM|nr:DUF2335 domain-containing protein [Methylomonas rapida]WAR43739.1 DUF2335 domain-containing protein [Methylomonas rapida]